MSFIMPLTRSRTWMWATLIAVVQTMAGLAAYLAGGGLPGGFGAAFVVAGLVFILIGKRRPDWEVQFTAGSASVATFFCCLASVFLPGLWGVFLSDLPLIMKLAAGIVPFLAVGMFLIFHTVLVGDVGVVSPADEPFVELFFPGLPLGIGTLIGGVVLLYRRGQSGVAT